MDIKWGQKWGKSIVESWEKGFFTVLLACVDLPEGKGIRQDKLRNDEVRRERHGKLKGQRWKSGYGSYLIHALWTQAGGYQSTMPRPIASGLSS
jgi:hypothetical protein